jgi:murein DD-endopeptidase MepM/ murein hydrolase activator NlpD
MTRRLVVVAILFCLAAAPAFGDDVGGKKQAVDSKISGLQGTLSSQQSSETALRSQIAGVTDRIVGLERQVGDVSLKLSTVEKDLGLHQERLAKLNRLFRLQTERWHELQSQYSLAVARLNERLVAIYESPAPSPVEVLFGSASLDQALNQVHFVTLIGEEDRQIATAVGSAKHRLAVARRQTAGLRRTVAGEERVIAAREAQVRQTRDALVGAANSLNETKQNKLVALSKLSASEQAEASEIDALQAVSGQLGAQIRAAQAQSGDSTPTSPSAAGLIWPVSGPVTSPFGWRWGRMHEGIDIGANTGTPIEAAAAGTVIYCGWEEGYGNFVVLDNGGDLATAYGHQSEIAVHCGEHVDQGQIIGYVGCTGHCTGPHLHFEVRINGNPVDPLGYL